MSVIAMSQLNPDVLFDAADLIAKHHGWTRFALARDQWNRSMHPLDPRATCFCMSGAIQRVCADHGLDDTRYRTLISAERLAELNDDPGANQRVCVAKLRTLGKKVVEAKALFDRRRASTPAPVAREPAWKRWLVRVLDL